MGAAKILLVALLVLDAAQIAFAGVASGLLRSHRLLLATGAVLLAVPLVLGLTGAISARTAVWIVLAAEVVAGAAARLLLERIHRGPAAV